MNSYFNFENTYTYLPKCFFTLQDIEEVPSPDLVIFNDKLAKSLDINIPLNVLFFLTLNYFIFLYNSFN